MLAERLADLARREGGGLRLREAMVGLGYTLVCLEGGACGLAYTLRDELERGCEAFAEAGSLAGREAGEVLGWLGRGSVIASALGLATANALLAPPQEAFACDLMEMLALRPGERVVTLGRFRPLEARLRSAGVDLMVVEREDSAGPLRDCDVALLTATAIINGTLEDVLPATAGAREVAILGPSAPCAPAAFAGTPVTILAGSSVDDAERTRAVVREGGGTLTLGKALRRWALRVAEGRGG